MMIEILALRARTPRTQYPVDSSIVRYFHHNEEKMRGYKVKFRSHIRTQVTSVYAQKQWWHRRIFLLRTYRVRAADDVDDVVLDREPIQAMEPLLKKLWKQSKFRLQLFFSKNWNESKFWNGFQKKNYIIWCFQEKRCQEFIFWRMNLKMNLDREKIPVHDINSSHDSRSTWVLMCIRRIHDVLNFFQLFWCLIRLGDESSWMITYLIILIYFIILHTYIPNELTQLGSQCEYDLTPWKHFSSTYRVVLCRIFSLNCFFTNLPNALNFFSKSKLPSQRRSKIDITVTIQNNSEYIRIG